MSKLRAVAYARYSSDGQRDESIDAQLRAINEYANKNNYIIVDEYIDRAVSGTTDNRLAFQKMINDSYKNKFDVVLVHKLDRFARNRKDFTLYRCELDDNNVKVVSTVENFGDSAESVILESVMEGYAEYYSLNLKREVMKGLKENALACKFTGGIPCLGYDIEKETLKYIINEYEAQAVKLIFKMYIAGAGYTAIINELNNKCYKTKRGADFGKNSIYEILRNEKYTGVYIYNKCVSVDKDKKFNRHATKSEDEIIRIEGGIPQIISKEDFELVQKKMNERKRNTAAYKAKQDYLLSGKIICGECGSTFAGNSRKANDKNPLYVSYNCTKKNGKNTCHNHGLRKDAIEKVVLEQLSEKVFDVSLLPEIIKRYNEYSLERNNELLLIKKDLYNKIHITEKSISNIVNAVAESGSTSLLNKLNQLEADKIHYEESLRDVEDKITDLSIDEKKLKTAFKTAKKMLKSGTLKNRKAIVQQYVKTVTVYNDKILIEYCISNDYTITEQITRKELKQQSEIVSISRSVNLSFCKK